MPGALLMALGHVPALPDGCSWQCAELRWTGTRISFCDGRAQLASTAFKAWRALHAARPARVVGSLVCKCQ